MGAGLTARTAVLRFSVGLCLRDLLGLLALCDQLAGEWNQALAVVDCIIERVEAANQEGGNPQVVVIQQGFSDLFGGAHQ